MNLADSTPANPATRPADAPRSIPWHVRGRIAFVRAFLMAWVRAFSLSGLYLFGRVFGSIEYLVDYKRRRRVHRKLREYFHDERPPAWFRATARRYFMRVRCDKMFYTIMDRIPRAKLMNRIKLHGGEHLDEALARGHGVYVALSHFGAHHVAGLLTALLGYRVCGVRDPKESYVRRYIQEKYRQTFPEVAEMKMFHSTSFPREIFRQFRDNRLVASLLDVDRRRGDNTRTYTVRFFGEPREWLIGPIQIALRSRAPMLQGFIESRRNFYYGLMVAPPLLVPGEYPDEDQAIAAVMQRYADGIERFARERPDHLMNI